MALCFLCSPRIHAQLVLNEVLASNIAGLRDEDGQASDWIELHNRGGQAVDLLGWSLSDDPGEPRAWLFPARLLGPGQYLVVFASGKDRRPASGNLHTGFKLNPEGEYLGLFPPGEPAAAAMELWPRFPQQRSDHSYGLDQGGALRYFATPTPGAANAGGLTFAGFAAEPRFGVESGFFDAPFTLSIVSGTPGAAIYYSLDGREPTPASGTRYTGPLLIAGSERRAVAAVRASAHKAGLLPSRTATRTYIFPEQVLWQPPDPDGFPTTWGAAPAVDYEMDPEVVGDPLVAEGLLSLPAVSLVMDPGHLFGPQGLYSNPGGQGTAWERPGSVELVFPPGAASGERGFRIDCGIRIQGGASREVLKSPKHAFRLLMKGDHGPSRLEHDLFPGSRVDRFDVLVLRAAFNNTWIHWHTQQRTRAQYLHDQWAHDTQRAMGQPSPHGRFVHLYLNGLYWGLYNLIERPNAPFAASYLGGEREDYDALNAENTIDGDRVAWNTMMGLANAGLQSEPQYRTIQEYLDVANLADYMILNIYAANQDWPGHNWYAIRKREPGAGYRFVSWDAERILEEPASNRTGVSDDNTPARLYSQLRANPEFRVLFGDRLHRHFLNGGALTPEAAAGRYLERAAEIESAVAAESARWGDYRRDLHPWQVGPFELYTRDHWLAERERLLRSYFPQRSAVVLNQFASIGLYPAIAAPVFSRHGGPIEPGFALTMALPAGGAGTILYTLNGSDPRVQGSGEVAVTARAYDAPVVLAGHTRVMARVLLGGNWSALNEATFTVPSPLDALRITEIMYAPAGGGDHEFLELLNSGAATLDLSGLYFSEGVDFVFPEHSTLGPGEFTVLARNAAAFASVHPGTALGGVYAGSLDSGGEKVTLKDPAGATIVSVDYDDEGLWPLGADGFGRSLVLEDRAGNPDDPESWRSSRAAGGSPGAEDPAALHGRVVVSEVLPRSSPPFEGAIELHNPTGEDIPIGGWYLSDSREDAASLRKFRIPAGAVVPAGGHAVFYEGQWNAAPGPGTGFVLDPRGGGVYLAAAAPDGSLTGHIAGAEFGAAESGIPFGRHRTSAGIDFTALSAPTFGPDPSSIEEFRTGGGRANAPPLAAAVVLNEISYHPGPGGEEFIEIQNRAAEPAPLHDAASGRGWRLWGVLDALGVAAYQFGPEAVVPPRGYLLLVATDPGHFRSLYAVPAEIPVVGPYGGALDNSGERLRLERPDPSLGAPAVYRLVDHVRYNDKAPWPQAADGEGPTLERISSLSYGNDPLSFSASAPAGGTPGRANSSSPPGDNRLPIASFEAEPRSGPAPLLVAFDASASHDPDGEIVSYHWDFGGGAAPGGATATRLFDVPGEHTVTLTVADDRGGRTSAALAVEVEPALPRGGQLPGDLTQDGRVDVSDVVGLLFHLFLGSPVPPPCGGESVKEGGNLVLLDSNGDGGLDVADALHALHHLFLGGASPAGGTGCAPVTGCPEACAP